MDRESTRQAENKSGSLAWHFVSEPALHPMRISVQTNRTQGASAFIFATSCVSEETKAGQEGALIMDDRGNPIWFRPLANRHVQNADFKVQTLLGEPVLTLWQGAFEQPSDRMGYSQALSSDSCFLIMDRHYRVIKLIRAQNGFSTDGFGFSITGRNTALFTASKLVPADLSAFGGPINGCIVDRSVQEIDIKTGCLLFLWDALSNIDPADSTISIPPAESDGGVWDCFRATAVKEEEDALFVSIRGMNAVYILDRTGKTLCKKPCCEQYEAEIANDPLSKGTFEWTGLPIAAPKIAAKLLCRKAAVFVSWNGSTQTQAWRIWAGRTPRRLAVAVEYAPRSGFETLIPIPLPGLFFKAEALDSNGEVIGTSRIVRAQFYQL